jgi:DNA-binding MarR family transcriptional regulator
VSPRWLRQDERDPVPWEQRQDRRLENLLGALVVTLGEQVQEQMAAAAGCSSIGVAALQWLGRGSDLRARDLVEALDISAPGASQLVASLTTTGLIERMRHAHDRRQWRLQLTELGARRTLQAMRARAELIREVVASLPFPWRLRLLRIVERLLTRMVTNRRSVVRICRHCDWNVCRHAVIEPCPVALAHAEWTTSNRGT